MIPPTLVRDLIRYEQRSHAVCSCCHLNGLLRNISAFSVGIKERLGEVVHVARTPLDLTELGDLPDRQLIRL